MSPILMTFLAIVTTACPPAGRLWRIFAFVTLVQVCAGVAVASESGDADAQLELLGWIEKVRLPPADLVISAKLDTGADNSSLHAPDPEIYEQDGERRVRFTVTNLAGKAARFDRPLKHIATIVSASGETERPVVEMTICIAGIERQVDVNLADRGDLTYPMLLGRSYLRGYIAVDSERKHLGTPVCDE